MAACGGGEKAPSAPTGPTSPVVDLTKPTSIVSASGGGQTVRIKSAVPIPVTFKVTNANGTGLAGITTTFAIVAGGGSLATATTVSGADGTVTLPVWTMGATTGSNAVIATAAGLSATAAVTARNPLWTVMVYMAADNNLAIYGYINLLQMAAAGVNPEVQVVVQAEFSPSEIRQYGGSPSDLDRPNYNTFRYVMDGSVKSPPNQVLIGPATDIGNVNMADPATLRGFVQWAAATAPSERTVLVLWNHGGDQTGLIADETSSPGRIMSLAELNSALSGLPTVDVLYFEMCLMGGYEPLSAIRSLARTAVASEDAEYVAGWDFQRLLTTIYAAPTASTTAMATKLADAFDAGYVGLGLSETIAAYDLSGFAAVDAAVGQLAAALQAAPAATTTALASASSKVQRFHMGVVTDLVDLSDSLSARLTATSTIVAASAAVKQAVTSPAFLLTNHHRNGTIAQQPDVSRSRGLTIVMPSSAPTTALASQGTASITGYQQQFPSTAWSGFLQRYAAGLQAQQYANIGTNRMSVFEIWNPTVAPKIWIEMLLLEPDGSVSSPLLGSLSPSGAFSASARITGKYYESWLSNNIVARGHYAYLAWLLDDATNARPLINVSYRLGAGAETSLYGGAGQPAFPQLSMTASWLNDPNVTDAKINAGLYGDLKLVATWDIPAIGPDMIPSDALTLRASIPAARSSRAAITSAEVPQLTPAQWSALRGRAPELIRQRALLLPTRSATPSINSPEPRSVPSPP